jgi:peptidoglycan/LPS O-acetylase OafA/YrhL
MASSSDPIEASPTDGVNRVTAMCLACLVPGVVALVWFAWTYAVTAVWPVPATAMPSGSIAAIRAAGIVCAVGGPLFGVMVGRWTRFPGAGLVAAFVLFGWVMLSTVSLAMSASRVGTLIHVAAPSVGWVSSDSPTFEDPWIAGGSPLWHLVYIAVLCGLAATAAMLFPQYSEQGTSLAALGLGVGSAFLLLRSGWSSPRMAYVGSYSFAIYLLHVFFTAASRIILKKIGVTDIYVLMMAGLAAGLAGPIVSALLISRHAGLNLWLLGTTGSRGKAKEAKAAPA